VGEFILVISGSVKDSNQALVHHIELIWECLQFYCGSLERILQKSKKDRVLLQNKIKKKAKYLIPLVNSFHKSPMKFSPMPYVELAPGYSNLSSHFVMAWQLLNLISLNESLTDVIYGSCLVYKGSVVCTQLDVASTRWIANIVEAVTTDDSSEFTEATENFFKVFVNLNSITSLTNKSKINIKSTEKISEVLPEQPQVTF